MKRFVPLGLFLGLVTTILLVAIKLEQIVERDRALIAVSAIVARADGVSNAEEVSFASFATKSLVLSTEEVRRTWNEFVTTPAFTVPGLGIQRLIIANKKHAKDLYAQAISTAWADGGVSAHEKNILEWLESLLF